jgi:RND superfamily putative drug exporter
MDARRNLFENTGTLKMSGTAGRVARLPCGRRTKWLVLALWVVLLAALGPLAGKLTGAQDNESASWLPGNAESTKVIELQRSFRPDETVPAVVVYERQSGITVADRAKAAQDARAFADVEGGTGEVAGPAPSADGKALQTVVPIIPGEGGWDTMADAAKGLRADIGTPPDGLAVHITGQAGVGADSSKAVEGVDGSLLYAALAVVIVMLLLTYRSPVLWLLPVISAATALTAAQAVVYLLAEHADLTVNAQSAAILAVLVFGAGTDYALLLVARYREELRRHEDRHEAMAFALRRAGPAVVASAATVGVSMLVLLMAEMNSTAGLGPVAAIGVAAALAAMISLLPALLVIFGRWVFWPVRPDFGAAEPTERGWWARVGAGIARRPRVVWGVTAVVLGVMALGLTNLNAGIRQNKDTFVDKPDSIVGGEVLAAHFPAGVGEPVVVIGKASAADQLRSALGGTQGIVAVSQPMERNGLVYLEGTLADVPDGSAALQTVERARTAAHAVEGADAKVGGMTAVNADYEQAARDDNRLVIPLVLIVVFVILALLLRALVAPVLLIATVVLSFAAALGVSGLVFDRIFGFAGVDLSFPLFVFVFLVALGIDYNIFLMTRVREEVHGRGPRRGAISGLAATGAVITSAGLVLAGTFAMLATLPLVFTVELGFAVAFGVLLDTIVVRAVLVTALNLDLGRWMWWPSKLAERDPEVEEMPAEPALSR